MNLRGGIGYQNFKFLWLESQRGDCYVKIFEEIVALNFSTFGKRWSFRFKKFN